jgi:hypothetical protein
MELKTNRKLAVGVSREQLRNTILQLTEMDVFCFSPSENIRSFSVTMMLQKDYHLINQINKYISEIVETGLLLKWAKDSSRLVPLDNIINQNERNSGNIKLTFEHVQGAFLLLIVGYLLASVVFAIEIIIKQTINF